MASKHKSASNWSVTRLVASATLGVLLLVLSLGGATISAVTGIPISSGIVNVFVSGAMFAFCTVLIRQFGSATLMGTIYSILAIPLPLFGSPGFAPKVLVGIIVGLIADTISLILRSSPRISSLFVGAATQVSIVLIVAGLGVALGMPGIDKMLDMFFKPLPLTGVLIAGGLAGILGFWVYSRIENRSVVIRIQATRPSNFNYNSMKSNSKANSENNE